MTDYKLLPLGDFPLLSGETLKDARLAYQTYGTLSPARDNVVVLPTFYTGTNSRNEGFFGPGRAIDPGGYAQRGGLDRHGEFPAAQPR